MSGGDTRDRDGGNADPFPPSSNVIGIADRSSHLAAPVCRPALGSESERLNACDTVSERITQARAIIDVIRIGYNDKDEEFTPAPYIIRDALWAASALLKQADEASEKI